MKAMVISPKNLNEYKFLSNLFEKLGINSAPVSEEELEDIGMARLLMNVDRTKKVSRAEIMKKLKS